LRSQYTASIKGIGFLGTFNGSASEGSSNTASYAQTVFFHQSQTYQGYAEYGFYRDVLHNNYIFYWSNNSNCGGNPTQNTKPVCSSVEAKGTTNPPSSDWFWEDSGTLGQPQVTGFYTDSNSHAITLPHFSSTERWEASICKDTDGYWKFHVELKDSNAGLLWHTVVGPNLRNTSGICKYGCWYPIPQLYDVPGYVTIGTNLNDPNNVVVFNNASMTADRLVIGR
jgi:hypothetical protein